MTTPNDLLKHTNIDELVRPAPIDPELPQPAIEGAKGEPFRLPYNTTDPLQSQHYAADMAAGLSNPQIKKPVIVAAWLFLAVPAIAYWLFHVFQFFNTGHWRTIDTIAEFAGVAGAFVVLTAFCGLWPYVLLRRHAGRR